MLTVIPCEKECICGTCGRYTYTCIVVNICGTFSVLMNVHFQPECLVSSWGGLSADSEVGCFETLQVQGTMFCFKACWQCKLDFRLEHKVALLLPIQSKNTKTNLFVNETISILINKDSTSLHILPGYRVNGLGIVSNSVSAALIQWSFWWAEGNTLNFVFENWLHLLPVFWRTRVRYENCQLKMVCPNLGLRLSFALWSHMAYPHNKG